MKIFGSDLFYFRYNFSIQLKERIEISTFLLRLGRRMKDIIYLQFIILIGIEKSVQFWRNLGMLWRSYLCYSTRRLTRSCFSRTVIWRKSCNNVARERAKINATQKRAELFVKPNTKGCQEICKQRKQHHTFKVNLLFRYVKISISFRPTSLVSENLLVCIPMSSSWNPELGTYF